MQKRWMLMEMGCLSLEYTLSEAYESSFFFYSQEGGSEEFLLKHLREQSSSPPSFKTVQLQMVGRTSKAARG